MSAIAGLVQTSIESIRAEALRCAVWGYFFLGVTLTFLIPPFQVPDEQTHWSSAHVRYDRLFSSAPNDQSCSVAHGLAAWMGLSDVALQPDRHMPTGRFELLRKSAVVCRVDEVPYGGLLTYPGVVFARAVVQGEEKRGRKALIAFYLARLAHGLLVGLLFARLVALLSQRRPMPLGTSLVALLVVSPIFVQQSFAVSADPVCLAFALSLVTTTLFGDRCRGYEKGFCIALAVIACYTKPVLVALLPIAIIASVLMRAPHVERRTLYLVALAGILGVAAIMISYLSPTGQAQPSESQISIAGQVRHITAHPRASLELLHRSVVASLELTGLVQRMGWLDTKVSKGAERLATWGFFLAVAIEVGLLCLVCWRRLRSYPRGSDVCLFVLNFVFFYLALLGPPLVLYLTWTNVGALDVAGMQPRYQIPALLAGPLLFVKLTSDDRGQHSLATEGRFWSFRICAAGVFLLYLIEVSLSLLARYW